MPPAPSVPGPAPTAGEPPGILVDRDLRALVRDGNVRPADPASPLRPAQVQPASLDLRLGPVVHRVRAGFLPGVGSLEERVRDLSTSTLDLTAPGGAVLERGLVYLVRLEEELDLPEGLSVRFNPRSSAGRCDVFTRVLVPGHPRFDEAPAGYSGPLWLEVSPLSFPVRLARGDRLCQLRIQRGRAALSTDELRERYRETPLAFVGERPLGLDEVRFDDDGGLELNLGLAGRDPAGWRASLHTEVVDFSREGAHDPGEFWEPVQAPQGRCILAPESFYIFASRERLRIPPDLAAEMLPVDIGIGELRNNYAGFFDSGFGWGTGADGEAEGSGTPAVLEVRAHDVPFLVEDGQVFFRLKFFRTVARPQHLYGEDREGTSYQRQDLTLARAFRRR
ncbi:MAG: 2'-deoxycytidine 5'-triphosphate deaminase [Planctomycetota bacterium]